MMNTKVKNFTIRGVGVLFATAFLAGGVAAQQTNTTQNPQQGRPAQTEQQTTSPQTEQRTSPARTDQQQSRPRTEQQATPAQPTTSNDSSAAASTAQSAATGDIIETAMKAGNFTTLAKALEAAGLTETLKGAGPFTVFAPTDEAFAKLPAGTLDELLKPENKEKLKSILTYHVVPGKVMSTDVAKMNGKTAKTVQGAELQVDTTGGVKVGNAMLTQADIAASNGVIHVIDTVLMPDASGKMKSKKTQ